MRARSARSSPPRRASTAIDSWRSLPSEKRVSVSRAASRFASVARRAAVQSACAIVRRDGGAEASVRLEREVGKEEVMVHHDDLRLLGGASHPRHEALLEIRASCTNPRIAPGLHVPPSRGSLRQPSYPRALAGPARA